LCAPRTPWRLVDDGVAASIADPDGTVCATIFRRLEPAADDFMSVVLVDGDLDVDVVPLLRKALVLAIADRPQTVLDLQGVDFFGAAGVHVLVAAHRHAAARGRSFALRGVHGMTEMVMHVVGLDQVIPTIG